MNATPRPPAASTVVVPREEIRRPRDTKYALAKVSFILTCVVVLVVLVWVARVTS